MSEGRKEPLTHAGLIAHKLAIEARADVIGEQSSEDAASLKTLLTLLHYEIASNHVVQQMAAAKVHEFFDFARPEPTDAGPHATGWRCTVEGARMGNLSLRAQDRVLRAALALQRLYTLIGGGDNDGTWTWARPDWLDAFPEMTPENLAKANAAQKAADERRRREAEGEQPKLHAMPGQRRGQLKNGNPAGDYLASPRCGARTRSGGCCRQPAMANGRCRMHGGLSTGARTPEGQVRARAARFVHGCRTAEIIDFRAAAARSVRRLAALTAAANVSLQRVATSSPCHARESGHPGGAAGSSALDSRLRGNGSGGGVASRSPAGHGVHRSISRSPLGQEVNRKDRKLAHGPRTARTRGAQRDRVARVIPLHPDKSIITRPQAAQESFKASLLASTAAFTSPLSVFAPSRFNPSQATAADHLRSPVFAKPASAGEARSAFICGSKPSSRRNALLAGAAAFTSPLRVFAPLRFNSPAAAGHGVHRSVSSLPPGRRRAA